MSLKTKLRVALIKPSIWLCVHWPNNLFIALMRRCNHIQLTVQELKSIINVVQAKSACKFLIFGVGNDSLFWTRLNKQGRTAFLEDNLQWLEIVQTRDNIKQILLVEYLTKRTQWQALLESPAALRMALPSDIADENWDVIIVDAPAGWHDDTPGRMKSIYQASLFIRESLDVFVHDCNRHIEKIYTDQFLKPEHLMAQIGKLRHYHY